MTQSKRTKPTIADQLAILDEAVAFIEETPDIDAAIDRYEAALKVSSQLAAALQKRSVRIEAIKQAQLPKLPA